MSKRILAALGALLAFMAVLAVVPLATAEPAEAHDVYYWKTVRTCIVDPPINHCTTKRVRVSAHHSHPPPTTTTTAAPPPTTQPKQCPAGSHRFGNGCHSHGFTPPCGTGTWTPHAGHTTKQRPACPPPPECADGYSGTPPNCVKDKPKVCPDGQTGTPPNCTEPNKNGKGGGSGGSGQRPTQSAVRAALATGWSWLSGAVKWVADNNAEVSEAEAKAWEAQSEATKNAAASAAKGVVNGLEAFVKDLSESERQRINADLTAVRSMLGGWQKLNPAAQTAIGSVVCYGAGGAISAGSVGTLTPGGAAFAAGCGTLAYGSTKAPLPQLIPEGWTPPSDDDSGTDDDSGGGSGGSSQHQNDPDGDYDGDGKTTAEEAHEAALRFEAGELTNAEYYRIIYQSWCDRGDSYYCGKKPPQ